MANIQVPAGDRDWQATLCGCTNNPCMCAWAFLVPGGCCCMQMIQAMVLHPTNENREAAKACLCNTFLCCFGAAFNRLKVREDLGIHGQYFNDCLVWTFCPCCGSTQEWREVMLQKKTDEKVVIWNAGKY
jgi:Cys-rich protein (TIGR01571 family)